MCFVRAWKIELEAMERVETLSHHKIGGAKRKTPKSWSSILIQQSSAAEDARAWYSASVEEQETVGYCSVYQVIGELPSDGIAENYFISGSSIGIVHTQGTKLNQEATQGDYETLLIC